jgi:DNA repair ATPase RecN
MVRTESQINYNSPCLDVTVEKTEVNSGIRTNRTIKGRKNLDFERLKKCSENDFKWLNTDMLVEAVKNYFKETKDAIVINRIVNDLVRRIMSHAEIINAHEETIKELEDKLKELENELGDARKKQSNLEEFKKKLNEALKSSNAARTEQERELKKKQEELDKLRQEHDSTTKELTIKRNLVNKQAKIIRNIRITNDKLQKNNDELQKNNDELQKNLDNLRHQTLLPTPPLTPLTTTVTNEVQDGFTEEDLGEGFDGGARRTKKRRRSNKTKLVRRPQNRVYQRRTSRKRNKN